LAEHLLPFFKQREDSLELSELTEAIDEPSMQEDDSTPLALVMVGDLNSVKGRECFHHVSRECEIYARKPKTQFAMVSGGYDKNEWSGHDAERVKT
jgi:hypothetical protein